MYISTTHYIKGDKALKYGFSNYNAREGSKNPYKYFKVMVRNPKKMGLLPTLVDDRITNEKCETR